MRTKIQIQFKQQNKYKSEDGLNSNVSTLKPFLFQAKSGRKKNLIFEKWHFQRWQKNFAHLYCFFVNVMLTRYRVTSRDMIN